MIAADLDRILQRLAAEQSAGGQRFPAGLFPSYRSHPTFGYRRPDTNVFFTACTVFTLQALRPHVSAASQALIDQIRARATVAYGLFRNKDGLNTYNFWPTRPSRHFPNGHVFRRFDHFRIPDDIDDTAMVYLTTDPTPNELNWLKIKLAQHTNLAQRSIRNTYSDYRGLRAYSTWFGKNMPVDFDACALSNLLYCLYQYDLPRDDHDRDSLTYLRSIIETGRYVAEPFRCAPHYARTSLIIYHVARLVAAFNPPELAPIRARLIQDANAQFAAVTNRLEKILLATSLLRLGQRPSFIDLTNIEADFGTFHFFVAGLLTAYEQPGLNRLAASPLVHLRWQCDAHCWALVAEYVAVSR